MIVQQVCLVNFGIPATSHQVFKKKISKKFQKKNFKKKFQKKNHFFFKVLTIHQLTIVLRKITLVVQS
jgi:hypothetical protein